MTKRDITNTQKYMKVVRENNDRIEEQEIQEAEQVKDETENVLTEQSDNSVFILSNRAENKINVSIISTDEQLRDNIVKNMKLSSMWGSPNVTVDEGMTFDENVSTVDLRNVEDIDAIKEKLVKFFRDLGFTIEKNK